jgi:hypothetical protein
VSYLVSKLIFIKKYIYEKCIIDHKWMPYVNCNPWKELWLGWPWLLLSFFHKTFFCQISWQINITSKKNPCFKPCKVVITNQWHQSSETGEAYLIKYTNGIHKNRVILRASTTSAIVSLSKGAYLVQEMATLRTRIICIFCSSVAMLRNSQELGNP